MNVNVVHRVFCVVQGITLEAQHGHADTNSKPMTSEKNTNTPSELASMLTAFPHPVLSACFHGLGFPWRERKMVGKKALGMRQRGSQAHSLIGCFVARALN